MLTQNENLPRQLLGLSAQLFLYNTDPERYKIQIADLQRPLGNVVFGLTTLGLEDRILQFMGPMSFALLKPFITTKTELADYLNMMAILEPEKETPTLSELISDFDNIIILLGKKASGKGTVSQILNEEYGFPNMPTSDWLRAIAAARGYPEPFNPIILRELGDALRQEFGGEVLVWLTLQEYVLKDQRNVVFDGLRSEVEMEKLKGQPNVHFIWVDAPDEKRLERALSRARPGDPRTIEELLVVDAKSFPEAKRLKELCPYRLDNPEDSIDLLREKTESLMTEFLIVKPKITVVGEN